MNQTRISRLFERLRERRPRRALIGYLTAGDPCPDATPELVSPWSEAAAT